MEVLFVVGMIVCKFSTEKDVGLVNIVLELFDSFFVGEFVVGRKDELDVE